MSGHYPFDAFGNLLPGVTLVGGQVIAENGQVLHEANAAAVNPAVVAPEPEQPAAAPATPEPTSPEPEAAEADGATL